MNQYSQLSMLETAVKILQEKNEKVVIDDLLNEVIAISFSDLSPEEVIEYKTRLYTDIVASAKFVFVTKNEIDLKENNILKEYDKDGSEFYDKSEVVEADEDEKRTGSRFEDEEIKSNYEDDEDEAVIYDEAGRELRLPNDEDDEDSLDQDEEDYSDDDYDYDEDDEFDTVSDDLLDSAEEFDEDKYNEYMDEYEDQYED